MTTERWSHACHESAHCLAAIVQGAKVRGLSLVDKPDERGHCRIDGLTASRKTQATIAYAGRIAQRRITPHAEGHIDHDSAGDIAYIDTLGLSESERMEAYARAHVIIARHWQIVLRLAELLVRTGELSAVEILTATLDINRPQKSRAYRKVIHHILEPK